MKDHRILVIQLAKERHSLRRAGIAHGRNKEEWVCQCGVAFKGDGSLEKGRRHDAEVILAALDADAGEATE